MRDLPGLGETYLDSDFASKIDAFVQHARDRGVNVEFESAYRSQAYQDYIRKRQKETNVIFPPAEKSFHSAGLAVDIKNDLIRDPVTKQIMLDASEKAGLSWGGAYGDHVHFDYRPGNSLDSLIGDFADKVRELQISRMKGPI